MSQAPTRPHPRRPDDDDPSILDEVFDRALEAIERGERVLAAELVGTRADLRSQAERLVELAERVAVVRPRGWPAIPGYTILGELGRGGMGAVYLARQERLGGRPVALKVLPAGFALSARSRERFMLEARAIARLRHPNIVAIHDVVDTPEIAAFAMEWIEGTSLAHVIERRAEAARSETASGPGDALSVVRIGIDVARALHAVHQAGLLHRDVKPSNVLLRADGTPLLSDFGLVREEGTAVHTVSGQFVGTPAYAAPEQLRGERTIDPRADVFSLGATLYHATTLRRPHEEAAVHKILERIEGARIPAPRRVNPRLPRDLDTIISKAMEPEPERRYAAAADLAEDLERLATLRPIRARPSGLITRSTKLVRRNRGRILGGVIGGALALAVAAALVFVLFVAPRWHARLASEARIALLGEGFHNALFNRIYGGMVRASGYRGIGGDAALVERVDAMYARATRLPIRVSAALAQERDVVRLARDALGAGDAGLDVPVSLEARMPLTALAAERWSAGRMAEPLSSHDLEHAAHADLRALGLLDLLAGTGGEVAMIAWPRLDTDAGDDPVVEHTLGYLYLLLDRPALAYPRLRAAAEAFPDIGFAHTFVADAAIKVGDLERAERILSAVESMPQQDTMAGTLRVRLELLIAQGRHEEALALARADDESYRGNPLARAALARSFEARGEHELAFREMLGWEQSDLGHAFEKLRRHGFKAFLRYERDLIGFGDRWWASLSEKERRAWIGRASAGDTYERFALARYLRAVETVRDWPPMARMALPGAANPADPPAPTASALARAAEPFAIPEPER
jgi:serine/threonine protein kinase/tetratricopeptide (TPR) repeat protein